MDCGVFTDHLSPFADNELDQEMAEQVRGHLDECPRCQRLVRGHMTIKQLLPRKLPFEQAPPGLRAAVLDQLDASPSRDFFHGLFSRLRAQPFLASGVAVSAFLAVFAGILLVMNSHRLPPLLQDVLAHHVGAAQHPIEVPGTDASQLAGVLREKFDIDISIPDLSAKGCALMGASRCPLCDRPAIGIRYGHPKANVMLFALSEAHREDFPRICKAGTLQEKKIDGETYFYCETKSCRAILWWEKNDIIIMTSCLPFPDPFETAAEVRRGRFPHGT